MRVEDYGGDTDYIKTRLGGTVVLYNNLPHFVDKIASTKTAFITRLGHSNYFEVLIKDLDINPFPLGLVNVKKRVTLLTRTPSRQYKQGLWDQNFKYSHLSIPYTSKQIEDLVSNKYPRIQECAEMLSCQESDERAFSREFFMGAELEEGEDLISKKNYPLNYRFKPVGLVGINPKEGSVSYSLKSKYKFLEEMLMENWNV